MPLPLPRSVLAARFPACPDQAQKRPGHWAGLRQLPQRLPRQHQRGISLEHIRRDLILQEDLATGADPLHLALVFNIDHANAMAYAGAPATFSAVPSLETRARNAIRETPTRGRRAGATQGFIEM